MPLSAQWSVLKGDPRPKKPAHLYQEFDQKDWDASNYASQKNLKWFQDAKYGMFVHFGLSTYKNAELSWGICKVRKAPDSGEGPYPTDVWTKWADEFKLPEFDAKKLVQHARDAGMQYIVVIAKHHDGFHMWNTEFSDFKISNTPFGRDFVKEVADECHQTGMKFGIYYSQRDWYHPDYCPVDPRKVTQKGTRWKLKPGETNPMGARHKKYLEYQNNVCRELCTKYGKIVYLHILSLEGREKLVLSGLEQKVVSAARLDGTPVQFTQNGGKLELMLPAKIQDKVNTIVKLTLDSPVRSVIDTKPVKSMFEDPEYGSQ
jgi:alpha-L-fucosidase